MVKMAIQLNDDQRDTVNAAVSFFFNSPEQIFQISGAAGTGKSVVLNAIVESIGLTVDQTCPMAYTGAAAIVMRLKGLTNAKTIHSWMYEPKLVNDYSNMDPKLNRPKKKIIFVRRQSLGYNKKLIIIDEASFVPSHMLPDLLSFGLKIIVSGDLNQLPPVADKPAFLYSGEIHYLRQIMRQAENNAIVYFAHELLKGHKLKPGWYGNVCVMYDSEIWDSMIMNSNIVICGKNDTREKFNRYIREKLLNFHSQLPQHGERMICRKNNWKIDCDGINLANGLIGTVANFPDITQFTGKTYAIDFSPDMFQGVFRGLDCDYRYLMANRHEKDMIKKLPYSNGEKFEYAYAITTHISQGSQYVKGMYFEEFLHPDINKNLNYTGITRFSRSCWYIIHKPKYY